MEPYYNYSGIKIYFGNALEVLKSMEAESAQCCVTSPPYFGLRNYQIESQIWDGDKSCEHIWSKCGPRRHRHPDDVKNPDSKQAANKGADCELVKTQFCQKCGAWEGSLGNEPTMALYIDHLVQIFHEVKRVLRKDGTLWLVIGDSYAGSGSPGGDFRDGKGGDEYLRPYNRNDLPAKNLYGIPWRVAFALQADEWILRQDIIWNKPSCMPESVKNRCTKSHEYIFLLTKSAKYYYDYKAIMEDAAYDGRKDTIMKGSEKYANGFVPNQPRQTVALKGHERWPNQKDGVKYRNKRSVWTINTKPYKAAHFATFPPELPRTCILAGSKPADTIIDPFGGAMTTLMVAQQLNRKAIGIELNEDYIEMGINRLSQNYLPFG